MSQDVLGMWNPCLAAHVFYLFIISFLRLRIPRVASPALERALNAGVVRRDLT